MTLIFQETYRETKVNTMVTFLSCNISLPRFLHTSCTLYELFRFASAFRFWSTNNILKYFKSFLYVLLHMLRFCDIALSIFSTCYTPSSYISLNVNIFFSIARPTDIAAQRQDKSTYNIAHVDLSRNCKHFLFLKNI